MPLAAAAMATATAADTETLVFMYAPLLMPEKAQLRTEPETVPAGRYAGP